MSGWHMEQPQDIINPWYCHMGCSVPTHQVLINNDLGDMLVKFVITHTEINQHKPKLFAIHFKTGVAKTHLEQHFWDVL